MVFKSKFWGIENIHAECNTGRVDYIILQTLDIDIIVYTCSHSYSWIKRVIIHNQVGVQNFKQFKNFKFKIQKCSDDKSIDYVKITRNKIYNASIYQQYDYNVYLRFAYITEYLPVIFRKFCDRS